MEMHKNQSYLYQLRAHLMYYYITEVYVDTAKLEYEKVFTEDPNLIPFTELFEDIDKRRDYAEAFRKVIEIYLGKSIPKEPKKSYKSFLGALVYASNVSNGMMIPDNSYYAIGYRGMVAYDRYRRTGFKLVESDKIDEFFYVLRYTRTHHDSGGTDPVFINIDTKRKFDWRGGMTGSGRFKKEWAEKALESFSSGIFSPFSVDGLTKQSLYDILEESNDDSLACRYLMEVLLEQITTETPTTES